MTHSGKTVRLKTPARLRAKRERQRQVARNDSRFEAALRKPGSLKARGKA